MTLDQKIRASFAIYRPGAGALQAVVSAVLDEHPHRLLDEHSRETTDDSAAKYGRCGTCGNVRDGVYCSTVVAIASTLGIDTPAVSG